MDNKYDFSGWATKNDLKCSDGRTIRHNAFAECDGNKVPLVWNHFHEGPEAILGHALLENRDDGVYAYCSFNGSEKAQTAKEAVKHGDISHLSIYANKLQQRGGDVLHGVIREVSLVLAGANPGAYIENILVHGELTDEEFVFGVGDNAGEITLSHAEDESKKEEKEMPEDTKAKTSANEDDESEETVKDIIDTMNEKQKTVMYALVGQALQEGKGKANDEDEEEEKNDMKHNVFDQDDVRGENVLSHAEQETIINDMKRFGSMKESFLQHSGEYGITDINYLFPDAKSLNTPPEFIKRDTDWVSKVLNGTKHTPFSRIKSMFANITEDEARAKGYIKGHLKKEEFFGLIKRTTDPQTIYKKQKLDRDDMLDITDFDVVAWLKGEMRLMLDEEIARAILIGDGRLVGDEDHISHDHIRPIASDADLYTIKKQLSASATTDDAKAKEFIKTAIKARKDYKGSGSLTLYTTEDIVTDILLLEDTMGRPLYESEAAIATKLRVKEIVTVPVMEGVKGPNNGDLMGIFVNLADYNVGADKGGAVSMFDDFDIDYNQMKYLIETRCSGALIKPYSAIVIETAAAAG